MTRRLWRPLAALCVLALPVLSLAQPASLADLDPAKALSQFVADGWDNEDGLPQSRVEAIAQSTDGYLWFGTQEGLVRFDGVTFTAVARGEGGLPNADIRSLLADDESGVWVGTRRGGLVHVDADLTVDVVASPEALPHPAVSSLALGPGGELWIGTFDGLCRRPASREASGEIACLGDDDGLPTAYVRVLLADATGVWVGTRGGLARVENGRVQSLADGDAAASGAGAEPIGALALDGDGGLWVGPLSDHPLGYYRDGQWRQRPEADAPGGFETEALLVDRLGTLWVGTAGGGLVRARGAERATLEQASGADLGVVQALLRDREGSLWIGTGGGGLARLRDAPFTPVTTREGLPADRAYSVAADPRGGVWVGTTGGLAYLSGGRVAQTITADDGLLGNDISTVFVTRDGTVWAGVEGEGLCRIVGGRVAGCLTEGDGLPDPFVIALAEDARGQFWVGTSTGVGVWTGVAVEPRGAVDAPVTALASGADGTLWVGTYGRGLLRFDGTTNAETVAGTEEDNILTIHVRGDGTVWAGTDGGGVLRIEASGGAPLRIGAAQGLPSEIVPQILEDGAGQLWITSNRGIARVEPGALAEAARQGARAPIRIFGRADGLPSPEANGGSQPAGAVGTDGTLYIPTNGGVAFVDPAALRRNRQRPLVAVERLVVDGERVPIRQGPISLAPGSSEFEIDYAGLSTFAPGRVQHRFRLEGRDDTWTEAGTRRAAYYTDLAPGEYTFRVQASNGDGLWSETDATVSFRLRPYFWQTGWFAIVAGLLAVGLVVGAYRVRTARLRARAVELEGLVDARTRELAEEKAQVEHLNGQLSTLNATLQDQVREQLGEIVRGSRLRKYFPKKVVDKILNQEGEVTVDSERRRVTVVFTDLAGFTRLSEAMPPEAVTALLNEYLNEMVALVDTHGGTLDKFMGDGIMVLFGAADPMPPEDQAHRALAMGASMQAAMRELLARWRETGMTHPLDLRIGIHQADVTVGNFGSDELVEFTAIGRGVNLAARLEGACEPGGVLASGEVRALAPEAVAFGAPRALTLKGIEGTVEAFPVDLDAVDLDALAV